VFGIRVLDALVGIVFAALVIGLVSTVAALVGGTLLCLWDHMRAMVAAIRSDVSNEDVDMEL
jgi:hypothetical protein